MRYKIGDTLIHEGLPAASPDRVVKVRAFDYQSNVVHLENELGGIIYGGITTVQEMINDGRVTIKGAVEISTMQINPHLGCRHNWKVDSYFSANKYETCTLCGKRKEDL